MYSRSVGCQRGPTRALLTGCCPLNNLRPALVPRRKEARHDSTCDAKGIIKSVSTVLALRTARTATVAFSTATAVADTELLRSSDHEAGLHIDVKKTAKGYEVDLQAQPPRPMVLHWAVNDWLLPPQGLWPANTNQAGDKAAQTRFGDDGRIRMRFNESECPQKIVFVLKELQPEAWLNDGGTDFTVHLKPPGLESVAEKVIAAESTYSHWSLFNRFCLAIEVLDAADVAGPEGMALVFTWLRLSSMRQLDWYRNSNYQSKDIAHIQKTLAERVAEKARSAKDPWCRLFARMALEGLPRGGGNGDDIRMGILHIMRAHGIKEGHRPGIDERFLEQWHQKLHTNTTPDDIAICEAYLAFLHSNNHDDYWRVLWDVGRLSKQDLENFSKPITAWPMHLPHLIDPFKGYLWLLKVTHSGADLDTAAEMAKGFMDDDLRWNLFDLLKNRNEWWAPGKIVEVRSRLAHYWKQPGSSRDLLLLDIALDSWFRLLLERTDVGSLRRDDAMGLVSLVARNALIAVDDADLQHALAQWEWTQGRMQGSDHLQRGQVLELIAAVQRMELALSAHMDRLYNLVQPHADAFAAACKLDKKYITNFGEEVARGRPLFVLSPLLKKLEVEVYSTGAVPPWQVVSTGPGSVVGVVQPVASLAEVQGKAFAQPTILLAEHVAGDEDIPTNVVAVITKDPLDVLSHAAIRARAQRVLLACTYLAQHWEHLSHLAAESAGTHAVTVTIGADGTVNSALGGELPGTNGVAASNGASNGSGAAKVQLQAPAGTDSWVLTEPDFAPGLVGAKSMNCAALARARGGAIPEQVGVPSSLSLPLGTFERVLQHAANEEVAGQLAHKLMVVKELASMAAAAGESMTGVLEVLAEIRSLVATQLAAPDELVQELSAAAAAAGMIPSANTWAPGSAAWRQAWNAICKVWSSKWNDRAWLSRRAVGVPDDQLYMAVLLQQVVPADYAFVLHTAHPVTGAPGQTFGEVVVGMGEALVGNYPGRALSFISPHKGSDGNEEALHLGTLPSKRVALRAAPAAAGGAPLLIARSDANGEDLKDLAGAGLYDSVPFCPLEEQPVAYAQEPLLTDDAFRSQLLMSLVEVGRSVREAFNGVEQDIEGVVQGGNVWVVQSRPQIIHSESE